VTSEELDRFVEAQAPVIDSVRRELAQGKKTSHWMWFVFPQIAGLGSSPMSELYAIQSLKEARQYLSHPILGEQLRDCTRILLETDAETADEVFGHIDAKKLRSSMTLFALADPRDEMFPQVLDRWFGGQPDPATVELLGAESGPPAT
jgi:uncharacterized protein (DUF1810 family)